METDQRNNKKYKIQKMLHLKLLGRVILNVAYNK